MYTKLGWKGLITCIPTKIIISLLVLNQIGWGLCQNAGKWFIIVKHIQVNLQFWKLFILMLKVRLWFVGTIGIKPSFVYSSFHSETASLQLKYPLSLNMLIESGGGVCGGGGYSQQECYPHESILSISKMDPEWHIAPHPLPQYIGAL